MKRLLCAAMVLAAWPAMAGEIMVKVSDADQAAFGNLPQALDTCVAGLRPDAGQMCKAIAAFATEFGAKVKAAVPPPEKPADK